MKRLRIAAVAVAIGLAGAAAAQSDFNLERLRLDPSAQGSLVLPGGEVMPEGAARLSLTLHFERDPLVVATDGHWRGYGVDHDHTKASTVVHDRWTAHLGGAYGLAKGLELVGELPIIASQSGDAAGLDGFAVAAPRAGLRLGAAGPSRVAGAVSVEVSPQWSTADAFEGDPGWQFIPGIAASWRAGGSMFLANVQGLVRSKPIDLGSGEELGNELQAGVGWATTGAPLRFELTARGALESTGESAELLAGLRYKAGPAELYAIAGPGFRELAGTPTFRALVGVALDTGPAAAAPPKAAEAPPAAAPAPVAKADPCAAGQKHTAAQCPDLDDDGDGVANAKDACPEVKGVAAEKGCPVKDSDGDGIADADDRCPSQAGVPAEQGCPPARAAINAETGKIDIKEKVFFDTGKATIQPRSFKLLDDVASLLAANLSVGPIAIEGHTDDRGAADYNRTLSKQRAEAVKAYLVGKGIQPARLDAKGLGPDRPAEPNATAAGREANRRVEFVIENLKKP